MSNEKIYIKNLSFYDDYPSDLNVSLVELERLVITRINILQTFSNFNKIRENAEWVETIDKALVTVETDLILNDLENDNLSHWILLLTLCSTSKIDEIIHKESDFFAWKLTSLNLEQIKELTAKLPLPIQQIARIDKINLPIFYEENPGEDVSIYRIKFNYVKKLVSAINVFLYLGYAYIPDKFLSSVICEYFTDNLTKKIHRLRKMKTELSDPRIYFLENIVRDRMYMNLGYFNSLGPISLNQLPELAKFFPLCMRMLFDQFKASHFLNHFQRRQLMLFFKGIGLDIELCHKFFFSELTQRLTEHEYKQKRYKYEIDYCYGIVGNRNWKPHDCYKIINESKTSNALQMCGNCPFVTDNRESLENILKTTENQIEDIEDIVLASLKNEPQTACEFFFQKIHGRKVPRIKHPLQYFIEGYQVKDASKTK